MAVGSLQVVGKASEVHEITQEGRGQDGGVHEMVHIFADAFLDLALRGATTAAAAAATARGTTDHRVIIVAEKLQPEEA